METVHGGDEFCVLLREPEGKNSAKEKFFWVMGKRRKVVSIMPFVSYGSAELFLSRRVSATPRREQSQKMYEDKKEHKGEKGQMMNSPYRV